MRTALLLLTIVVGATIITGIRYAKNGKETDKAGMKRAIGLNLLMMALVIVPVFVPQLAFADASKEAMTKAMTTQAGGLGFLGAALSTGLAAIGAGIAVGQAGSAAIGAISEDSSILGKTLIILGLAEGIAIYGLVISILILQRL